MSTAPKLTRTSRIWLIWAVLAALLAGWLGYGLTFAKLPEDSVRAQARKFMLPGKTTAGHHQIELACNACHSESFGGRALLQDACVNCHGAELKEARDSHPKSKFTDPRNAERAALLDAAMCVTCHVEHKPAMTHPMGVTLPPDLCKTCHYDVAKERPSHAGLGFDTCASSGCHNFHDNRALYEDFLLKHAQEPVTKPEARLAERDFRKVVEELSDYPAARYPLRPLSALEADHGKALAAPAAVMNDWLATSHAQSGVNCSACHTETREGKTTWLVKPGEKVCESCHSAEIKGFKSGKHGMRLAQELSPMRVSDAQLPMKKAAHDKALSCVSCHAAHRFDTRTAAVESCSGCHNDKHTVAYKQSKHYTLWQKEVRGEAPAGSGVSCATCHMPRVEFRTPDDVKRVLVQHNQNDNLRPNEKMIRPVCMSCHGLGFSIDALADGALIQRNFTGQPAHHIKSIDMSLAAEARADASRSKSKQESE